MVGGQVLSDLIKEFESAIEGMANNALDWTHFNLSHGYINTECKCSKCDRILTTSYKTKDSLVFGHCKIRKSANIRTNFSNHLQLYYWCRKPTDSKKAFFFSTLQLHFTAAALYTFKVKKGQLEIEFTAKLNWMQWCNAHFNGYLVCFFEGQGQLSKVIK